MSWSAIPKRTARWPSDTYFPPHLYNKYSVQCPAVEGMTLELGSCHVDILAAKGDSPSDGSLASGRPLSCVEGTVA